MRHANHVNTLIFWLTTLVQNGSSTYQVCLTYYSSRLHFFYPLESKWKAHLQCCFPSVHDWWDRVVRMRENMQEKGKILGKPGGGFSSGKVWGLSHPLLSSLFSALPLQHKKREETHSAFAETTMTLEVLFLASLCWRRSMNETSCFLQLETNGNILKTLTDVWTENWIKM